MAASTKTANTVSTPATLYPVSEIVAASDKIFDGKYKKAIVLAALSDAKVSDVNVADAIKIVTKFASAKVTN